MAVGDAQVRVIFPLSGIELQPVGLRLRMAEYAHEIAIVSFLGTLASPATTGAPVSITWGTPTRANFFLGYFDHLVSTEQGSSIVCIGASYPMKNAAQQVWTDATADQVAYEIADRHQLDGDITPHDRVFPQIVQSGESDWQFLVRLAKSVGYSCYVRQTQLRFHPRTRDFLGLQSVAPVFGARETLSFAPVTGTAVPDEAGMLLTTRQLTSMDPGGDIATAASFGVAPSAASVATYPAFTSVSQQPVDSIADAMATLVADREMGRWYLGADAIVTGDISVRPAAPVYMGNQIADNNGYWCVLSAEHRVVPPTPSQQGGYTMALRLGRDSTGQSLSAPSSVPTAYSLDATTAPAYVVSPRLIDGRWTASPMRAVVEEPTPDFVLTRLAGRD